VQVRVTRLDPDLPLPRQQHTDDAGFDLHAREDATIAPAGGRAVIPTGLAIAIPPGYGGFVLPRSGLALHHGITCLNTPGLVDPQYRGELKVLLVNTDPTEPYTVSRGDRIAQLVVQQVEAVEWVEVDELDVTSRDTFGFGSTGGFGAGKAAG
jgi:dUTP pyrophosphatase